MPFSCPHKFVKDDELIKKYDHMKKADGGIKDFCLSEEAANAFMWIVLDSYEEREVELTEDMKEFKEDFRQEDETAAIDKLFIVTKGVNDFVPCESVNTLLQNRQINMTIKKFSLLVKNRGAKSVRKVVDGKRLKGYLGLKCM